VCKRAREILGPDPSRSKNDRIFIVYRAWGPTFNPFHVEIFSYKTWWFLAGPEAEGAKAYKQIEQIKIPILLIQGWHDDIVNPQETQDLAQAALNAGNKDVSAFYVNAGHTLEGKEEELGDIVVKWLGRRFRNK